MSGQGSPIELHPSPCCWEQGFTVETTLASNSVFHLGFPSAGIVVGTAKHTFRTLAARAFRLSVGIIVRGSLQRELTFASHFTGGRFTVDPGMACGSTDLK